MNLKSISLETTSEVFSSHSGLFIFNQLWKSLKLGKKLGSVLPRKKKSRGLKQVEKLKALVFSFVVGNDCLSDLDVVNRDKLFRELIGGNCSSTSMGDFLRSFGNRHLERLQEAIIESVVELRLTLKPEDQKFVLTMDSTPHEHYAKKMEGLAWNYKNMWCLDSQNCYDQYGFSYLFDLRAGNTFSGRDSERWVHEIFKKIPKGGEKWFRADSAYSKFTVFEALKTNEVKFAIALKDNIGSYVRRKNKECLKWEKTSLRFFDSNECEVAMGVYPLEKLGSMRVVFIRAPREDRQLSLLDDPSEVNYRHYSIITNIESSEMSEEEVIEFYRQRATAENYIREQKYGYDFLNFPCRRLKSNQVFGQAGVIAHNLMRALSLMMEQKTVMRKGKDGKSRKVVQQGYFAKKVRNELIRIAGRVSSSARKIKVRVNRRYKEVLERMIEQIRTVQLRFVTYKKLGRDVINSNTSNNPLDYGPGFVT